MPRESRHRRASKPALLENVPAPFVSVAPCEPVPSASSASPAPLPPLSRDQVARGRQDFGGVANQATTLRQVGLPAAAASELRQQLFQYAGGIDRHARRPCDNDRWG